MRCARKPTSVKQPKWHSLSTSSTACWRWDARATSASYETTRTRDHCVHRLIHATKSAVVDAPKTILDDRDRDLYEFAVQIVRPALAQIRIDDNNHAIGLRLLPVSAHQMMER